MSPFPGAEKGDGGEGMAAKHGFIVCAEGFEVGDFKFFIGSSKLCFATLGTTGSLSDTSVLGDSASYYTLVNSLLYQNDTISARGIYECNERKMNEITFKYLIADTLSTWEKNFIYDLAFSCEYSNGQAVYSARAWYAVIFNDDTTQFNDDSICSYSGGGEEMMRLSVTQSSDTVNGINKQISVYPNPAANLIYVVTSLNPGETGTVNIFDLNGVKVKEIKVAGGASTNMLMTDNLSDGIYTYRLTTNQQFTARGKLVIAR